MIREKEEKARKLLLKYLREHPIGKAADPYLPSIRKAGFSHTEAPIVLAQWRLLKQAHALNHAKKFRIRRVHSDDIFKARDRAWRHGTKFSCRPPLVRKTLPEVEYTGKRGRPRHVR